MPRTRLEVSSRISTAWCWDLPIASARFRPPDWMSATRRWWEQSSQVGTRHAIHVRDVKPKPRRRVHSSVSQEVEPRIGPVWRDLKNFRAHHVVDDERIVTHPRAKLRQRRPVRQNASAQPGLNGAGEQENAVVEAPPDPGIVAFHEL